MPEPLAAALVLQREAALQGFDWTEPDALWDKLAEEIAELRAAADAAERHEELGDLLFMVVNLARHLGVDPAAALQSASAKFARRYAHVMADAGALPPIGDPERLEQMEARWREAKRIESLENQP